jgi:hypothetical protein
VATIIQAVSAALISEVAAKAGVAGNEIAATLNDAASRAARNDSAPMVFPQPDFMDRMPAPLPDATKFKN